MNTPTLNTQSGTGMTKGEIVRAKIRAGAGNESVVRGAVIATSHYYTSIKILEVLEGTARLEFLREIATVRNDRVVAA